jgi:hypothetical protein
MLFHERYLMMILVLSFVNIVIDVMGHSNYRGLHRTPLTHSPMSATIIGGVWGASMSIILPFFGAPVSLLFMVAGGIISAWSHLFLDSMTFSGIFVFGKRFAIAHFTRSLIDVPVIIISFVSIIYILGMVTVWVP